MAWGFSSLHIHIFFHININNECKRDSQQHLEQSIQYVFVSYRCASSWYDNDCFMYVRIFLRSKFVILAMKYMTEQKLSNPFLKEKRLICKRKVLQKKWPKFASELYRPSDRCLSANLVPTFAGGGCHMVSMMDPYGRVLGFLDQSH
jgi:hypothetical protein